MNTFPTQFILLTILCYTVKNPIQRKIRFSPVVTISIELWKLLIDKDLKKKDLQRISGVSAASITKLAKNENVNTEIIEKVCLALHCDVGDIMEITKN